MSYKKLIKRQAVKRLLYFIFIVHMTPFSFAQSTQSAPANPILSGLYSSKNQPPPNPLLENKEGEQKLLPEYISKRQNYSEQTEKRTLTSRTFRGEDGAILLHYSSKNIHYFDKEKKLQPINSKLQQSENGWSASQQEFPTYLFTDGSTALTPLSSGERSGVRHKITFNKNCKICLSCFLFLFERNSRFCFQVFQDFFS